MNENKIPIQKSGHDLTNHGSDRIENLKLGLPWKYQDNSNIVRLQLRVFFGSMGT